jgi:hypothetical protein
MQFSIHDILDGELCKEIVMKRKKKIHITTYLLYLMKLRKRGVL